MRIAVVGGGLGGLTAARALASAGHDVHVLEASVHPGGVIGTSHVDGYVREHAASSFLGGPGDGALALCEALGVPVQPASARAKRRWIYLDGALQALPSSPLELARSNLLSWRGKLELVREPLRAARSPGAPDESMHAFAVRRFGAEAARAIVAPFVTGVYAADAHAISLAAGFPRIAALDAEGGVVRGMAKRMIGKLASRVRGRAPEPSTARGMWAPVGGVGALTAALARELGSRLRLASPVARIAATPGAHHVTIDGERWDAAVLAIPAEDAVPIVGVAELAAQLAGFHRAPSALVYLGFRAADVPRAADGFGALVAQGEDARLLGVVFESTVWPDRAPADHVLLRCIFGGSRDAAAAALDDASLVAIATRDLAHLLGAAGVPTHASVLRWPRGVAQYGLGHRDRVRSATAVARAHRLLLAGADYHGPGLNDLCADATRLADEARSW